MAKDIAKLIHEKLKERSENNIVQPSNIKQYVTEEFNSRNENVILTPILDIVNVP